jgi:hypothetical protein
MTLSRPRHRRSMRQSLRLVPLSLVLAGAAALGAGCTNTSEVPWATYDPALQDQIDSAALNMDCATLASLHLKAHLTSNAHENASGFTNAALIDYIETAQKSAGCPTS